MKTTTKTLLLLSLFVIPIYSMIAPVEASDGQFIDHILLFEPPQTTHTFNLTLEKNQRYEFVCTLYSPGASMNLVLRLTGPDGDGDGSDDEFVLGAGTLDAVTDSVASTFGCALEGNYTLDVEGTVSENTNLHLKIYDRGKSSDESSPILYDVAGYYDTKIRQYWFELEDDTEYTISACRTNSIPGNDSFWGQQKEAFVNVILYDDLNREFPMIRNIQLINVYGKEDSSATFGVSFKGEYHVTVEMDTTIDTVNLMILLVEGSAVGDGPEDDPVDPPSNSTGILN